MVAQILPIIILFLFVLVFAAGLIYLNAVASGKNPTNELKQSPYECGVKGVAPESSRISVKFYLTAISFILFDIEIIFLFPWILVFIENIGEMGLYLLLSMGIFFTILVYGLIYEFKVGGLEWD